MRGRNPPPPKGPPHAAPLIAVGRDRLSPLSYRKERDLVCPCQGGSRAAIAALCRARNFSDLAHPRSGAITGQRPPNLGWGEGPPPQLSGGNPPQFGSGGRSPHPRSLVICPSFSGLGTFAPRRNIGSIDALYAGGHTGLITPDSPTGGGERKNEKQSR